MRALTLTPDGRLVLDPAHPEPRLGEGEALVHVRQAGVCATDLELIRGYAGFTGVLGHEFVGIVDAADPDWAGRRVVADINLGCGRCPICRTQGGHHCRARTTLGIRGRPGVFAERVAIPRANLVAVPDAVPDDAAVFAEPLAAAAHVLDELDALDQPPTGITVLGDGKLGILIALALVGAGRRVELIGRHPHKLALAAQASAASGTGETTGESGQLVTLLEPELGHDPEPRASVVVDATGSPAGLARALSLVEPRGTVVLKTTTAAPVTVDLTPVVVNELRVVGSRCGDLGQAIALLASGRVDPRLLIAARYPLEEGPRAIDHASRRGTLEVLLDLGSRGG